MAAGDLIWFDQSYVDSDEGLHDKENDEFKFALISGVTPTASLTDPRWGTGGSNNLSTNEVTPGGNYPAGGVVIGVPTVTLAVDKSRWDAQDVDIAQAAGNPTATYAIVYNNTDVGKRCLFAIDLGGSIDLSQGPFAFAWNINGISETGAAV